MPDTVRPGTSTKRRIRIHIIKFCDDSLRGPVSLVLFPQLHSSMFIDYYRTVLNTSICPYSFLISNICISTIYTGVSWHKHERSDWPIASRCCVITVQSGSPLSAPNPPETTNGCNAKKIRNVGNWNGVYPPGSVLNRLVTFRTSHIYCRLTLLRLLRPFFLMVGTLNTHL